MRRNTGLVRRGGILVAVGLVLAGCGGGDTSDGATSPDVPAAAGDARVITPTTQLDGAERFESDGVSILVPEGWQTNRREASDYVQLDVYDPADTRNPVTVTVQDEAGDASVVDATSQVTAASLGGAGATGIEQVPASWVGWEYATAVTGTFDQGAEGEVVDFLAVTAVSASGTVVGVTAQAPEGEFEGSTAALVLASLEAAS